MESKEVLGIQAARRAIDNVRSSLQDPLARDRLERIEQVLSRVASALGRRADFEKTIPPQPADTNEAIRWAHDAIQAWEKQVADFDPRRTADEAGDEDLAGIMQTYLSRRFPEHHGLKVIGARRLPGGRSKHTLFVEQEGIPHLPSRLVMRTDSTRTTIYDTVAREFPAIAAVHKEGVPTPEPFWLEMDPGVIGAPFLACSHVPGEPVGNLYGANEGTGVEAGYELAEALGKLHMLPVTIVPGIMPQSARSATDDLFTQFERRWIEARWEKSFVIGQAFAWLRKRLDCLDGDAVIVHGDAHFSNMLMQDGKLTCMLDWEFWHTGHPAEDLAYCRPYVEQTGNWDDFLARYVAAGGRPVSQEALEMFDVWRPLRNTVLAATVSYDFQTKGDLDLETAAIASSTYFKMEALVAKALVKAIG